jgi:hypothetical protein
MTEDQHKRALEIKSRIAHIDDLIDFLIDLTDNSGGPNGNKAFLRETGFTAHPREHCIVQADVDCLREALGGEKLRLTQEFNML